MMVQLVGRCAGYAVGGILCLGPNVLYGLIKGAVDFRKYVEINKKIAKWKSTEDLCTPQKYDELKQTKAFRKILQQEPTLSNMDTYCKYIKQKASMKQFNLLQDQSLKKESLKQALLVMIPIVGFIFAWKQRDPEQSTLEAFIAHATNNHPEVVLKYVYPRRGEHGGALRYSNQVKIPVEIRGEGHTLDAMFFSGKNAKPTDHTIVLFHGNMMLGYQFYELGLTFQKMGYNVLMPTMGGYPGSDRVKTTEASTYQDVEAIKIYLKKMGIKKAGYYGLSIGGTLAFQAAVGKSGTDLETLFLITDKTLSSTRETVANIFSNFHLKLFSFLGKGFVDGAFPKKWVQLSHNTKTLTDGLDNLSKIEILKKRNIPYLAIKGTRDDLMGRNLKGRIYQRDFADDLIEARYDKEEDRKQFLVTLDSPHTGTHFEGGSSRNKLELEKILQFLEDKLVAAV